MCLTPSCVNFSLNPEQQRQILVLVGDDVTDSSGKPLDDARNLQRYHSARHNRTDGGPDYGDYECLLHLLIVWQIIIDLLCYPAQLCAENQPFTANWIRKWSTEICRFPSADTKFSPRPRYYSYYISSSFFQYFNFKMEMLKTLLVSSFLNMEQHP